MCLQCNTDAVNYGFALDGFVLMKAAKDDFPDHPNMMTWKKDQWALVEMNDPSFYLTYPPTKKPVDDPDEISEEEENFFEIARVTDKDIMSGKDVRAVYRLVNAAIVKGYNPLVDGQFGAWLTDYLAKYLETAQPIEE